MMTIQQALELGLQHHQAGRLRDAETLYRQILAVQPEHADALHYLGVIAHQVGRHDAAIEWIGRALALKPHYSQAYSNLGEALLGAGRRAEAIAAYEQALLIDPQDAVASYNLGNALRDDGRLAEAVDAFRRALEIQPDYLLAQNNLGGVLKLCGRLDEAVAAYEKATHLKPDSAEAWNNLGTVLRDRRHFREAIAAYQRALELRPGYVEAYNNLGIALTEEDRFAEAFSAYARAIELAPALAEVHYNLGGLLHFLGRLDEAVVVSRRAVELKPADALAYNQLGEVLKSQGALADAIDALRTASLRMPENPALLSNLIYTLHFQRGAEGTIAEEQANWNLRFSRFAGQVTSRHPGVREVRLSDIGNRVATARRLRIGYISPNFRDHVVGRNLVPLFRHHDTTRFELVCYSNSARTDALTEVFREHASHWRMTEAMSDEELAAMIQQDDIDILVDLAQHMGGNRLPVFARRPAPAQVSFAGYPESTGVEGIGCRISDRWMEEENDSRAERDKLPKAARRARPEGRVKCRMTNDEGRRSPDRELGLREVSVGGRAERLFLLDSFWCYDPCGVEVPGNALPAFEKGSVTFGCLNNFCKVNEPLLRLWARVLGEVKGSRLVLSSHRGSHRQRVFDFLEREGVEPSRVEFVVPCPRRAYLELYHRLDVVLDTFPYNGHTTSLDALWMGVPVVSLAGQSAVSRAGLSQLSNLGLPELVAHSEEEYMEIAARLAGDLGCLAELRATLRSRMEASVLMDAACFTRQIEEAYCAMWQEGF